jgi:hypothetical protein
MLLLQLCGILADSARGRHFGPPASQLGCGRFDACAQSTWRQAGDCLTLYWLGRSNGDCGGDDLKRVVQAKAGTQGWVQYERVETWIPTFVGMTFDGFPSN